MASIINSLRNLSSDNYWFIKILFLALPVFFILNYGAVGSFDISEQIGFCAILGIFYLGVVAILMHRNINNLSPILPSLFTIPEFVIKGIGMCIVAVPLYVVFISIISFIANNVVFEPFVMWVIYICVTLFLAPFVFIPPVLYCVNGKLSDAFNYKVILASAGNFSVAFLSYVIQYVFTILLFAYLFYRMFDAMVDDILPINIIYSITFVISILSFYSYCSDLYPDVIAELPKNKARKVS